jgi:phospholipid/cholesterol/gamma-HCH transport system substrate-binding protein
VPSRKEIQWSQLKVGALVLTGCAILVALIFLMNASTGGFLAHKITLKTYFENAGGIKEGSPVTLEGVTIGNVTKIHVVPKRNPTPVEVVMQVSDHFLSDLHTDSTASIAAAGVLGDSFVDINSTHAKGPAPKNGDELLPSGSPTIQSVINTSQVSIEEINKLVRKIEILVDTLNSNRGTIGTVINDPALAKKIVSIADNLQTITSAMAQGKGTLGQLINDNTLYTKLNAAAANINQLTAQINSGNGGLGKMVKDPAFAQKLDDTITNLDNLLKGINAGEGTAGQLVKNRALYDHLDQTADQAQQLIKGMRENPKKYLVIQLKVF